MESSFYPFVGALMWVGMLLLLGTFLRAKIKLFQKMMFPASLLGGLIGFVLMRFDVVGLFTSNGFTPIAPGVFGTLVFQLFTFGFVGIGLMKNASDEASPKGVLRRGAFWFGWMAGLLYAAQALIGFGTLKLYQLFFGGDYFAGNGYLMGTGFCMGPGQTQAYGLIWENTYGLTSCVDVGMAYAAVGFLVSGLVGVPFVRWGLHKGYAKSARAELSEEFSCGLMHKGNQQACAFNTTHPATIDTLAFHLALMFFLHACSYCFGLAWLNYFPFTSLRGIGIGFMYMWGCGAGMLAKKFMAKVGCGHLLEGETTRRLTNTTVDFMVCAVFLSIQPTALENMVIPFTIACVLGAGVTVLLTLYFARRSPELGWERAACCFGTCTGTVASGLMLLRIVDPKLETTVPIEVGLMCIVTIIFLKPIEWTMPFVPQPGFPMLYIFMAALIITPVIMKITKVWVKKQF